VQYLVVLVILLCTSDFGCTDRKSETTVCITADNGKLALCVRYGTKILELAKGKYAIEVASDKDLLSTLETVKSAVLAGELDTTIDNAANKLRAGFAK
jgi:hypothetical protein